MYHVFIIMYIYYIGISSVSCIYYIEVLLFVNMHYVLTIFDFLQCVFIILGFPQQILLLYWAFLILNMYYVLNVSCIYYNVYLLYWDFLNKYASCIYYIGVFCFVNMHYVLIILSFIVICNVYLLYWYFHIF